MLEKSTPPLIELCTILLQVPLLSESQVTSYQVLLRCYSLLGVMSTGLALLLIMPNIYLSRSADKVPWYSSLQLQQISSSYQDFSKSLKVYPLLVIYTDLATIMPQRASSYGVSTKSRLSRSVWVALVP